MSAPTNTSPLLATLLTLPYAITIPAADLALVPPVDAAYTPTCGAPTQGLWWTLTPAPGVTALGITLTPGAGSTSHFWPAVSIWTGSLPGITQRNDDACIARGTMTSFQTAISVDPGTPYWFLVCGAGSDVDLTLVVAQAPQGASVAGSILVGSDVPGYPAMVMDPASGAVTWVEGLGSFEQALPLAPPAVLGVLVEQLSSANHAAAFEVYDAAFHRLARLTAIITPTMSALSPLTRTAAGDAWYLLEKTVTVPDHTGTLSKIGADGTLLASWDLSGLTRTSRIVSGIAVNADESILYLLEENASGSVTIQRWDLMGHTQLLNLVTGAGTSPEQAGRDLLWIGGDLLAAVGAVSGPTIRRYNATTGTLTTSYTAAGFATSGTPRITYALDSPASVWAMYWPSGIASGDVSQYAQIRLADGATIAAPANVLKDPPDADAPQYGPSQSCPLVVLPYALVPPGPPPDAPTRTRIRRLRRAPHLSAEQAEQFFAKFQLDFEAGVGNAIDPGFDPQLWLRWSDDGGQTWRGPLAVSAGLLGAFRRRAIWRRLGRGRDRVFEVSMDDPVKWALVAANLDAVKGTS